MIRHGTAIAVGAVCLVLCASAASAAQQTPTNEQLYRMLLQQQKRIQRLERRATGAERALKKARATIRRFNKSRRTATRTPAPKATTASVSVSAIRSATRRRSGQVAARQPAREPKKATGGLFALAGPLFLRPDHSLLGFGIVSPTGTTPPTSNAPVESVNTSFTPGARVGFGYAIPDTGLDLRGTLAFLTGNWSRTLNSPTGGSIQAILSDPAATGADDANTAVANYRFRYYVADAEIGQKLRLGNATKVRLLFGLRFARISEELQVDYIGRNFGPVGDRVTATSRFWGVGPRIGADMKWHIPRMGGLFLAGNMDAALLLGQFDTARSQVIRDTGTTIVAVSQRDQASLVPAIGGKLALGWRGRISNGAWLSAELGYQFQSFIGGTRRIGFIDDVNGAAFSAQRDDLFLHGPYLEMKLRFHSVGQLFDIM